MKSLFLTGILLSAASIATAGDIASDESKKPEAPAFTSIDKNADGYISLQESQVLPQLETMFFEVDQDKNKRIDEKEYNSFIAEKR